MKILLISGRTPVPAPLRDLIAQGSTDLQEASAGEADRDLADADRVVFWAGADDSGVRDEAQRLARATDRREDRLVFVTPDGGVMPEGLADGERFQWPADEDRLKMAFITSA